MLLAYLNERNDAKKLRKIAITSRDRQAAVKSFTLFSARQINKYTFLIYMISNKNLQMERLR